MSMNMETMTNSSKKQVESAAGEYLTFVLGGEEYGIEILKVQEIRGYDTVTKIANTPSFIKGVINLRGRIVPIVDLRIKFNLENKQYDEFTVVIILNLRGRVVGIVVDGVSDVMDLPAEHIREVPDLVSNIDTQYILGLGSVEERMLILIDIEKLMNSQEMDLINSVASH